MTVNYLKPPYKTKWRNLSLDPLVIPWFPVCSGPPSNKGENSRALRRLFEPWGRLPFFSVSKFAFLPATIVLGTAKFFAHLV